MRKYFIDNIRWMAVLLLFPYHTARIFDGINSFYIKAPTVSAATNFVLWCTPWFMPILFVVAGISTRYALQKRSNKEYIKERFIKLFVPLLFGILLLVPIQTYFAEIFHNAYSGGYLEQYILFFTKSTDFSGYNGGFTPAQLWFVYYLFIISLVALPLINLIKKKNIKWKYANYFVIPLCLITLVFSYVLDIGGKSMGEYFSLFLLGYFVLAEESVQNFLDRKRIIFLIIGVVLTTYTVLFQTSLKSGFLNRGIMILTSWISIFAIMGMGHHHLNFKNKLTDYMSISSFSFYLFHQSWVVLIGFYILQSPLPNALQYIIILVGSLLGSTLLFEICRHFKLFRFMFGIKKV